MEFENVEYFDNNKSASVFDIADIVYCGETVCNFKISETLNNSCIKSWNHMSANWFPNLPLECSRIRKKPYRDSIKRFPCRNTFL